LLSFALVATGLVVTRRIRIIHARSYLPCLVALAIRAVVPRGPRVIFDMRGFWIDERAEAESWNPRGRAYRFGKALERAMLRRADAIVTLNVGARVEAARLRGRGGEAGITVIPTCVDTERFRVMSTATSDFLSPGWGERFVFVYTGAVGFWQDPETLVDFFAAARRERPDAAFLCLLRAGAPEMRAALDRAGLTDVSRVEEHVAPDDLPRWLGIPRVGIVWYRPTFSRLGNFPTKLGEYLACGLPVVIAGATADSVELVVREGVGVVVREFSPAAYRDALAGVLELAADRETPARCRRIAERELSLSIGAARYANIYRGLVERA
jgi:glycosyltransferase involved in cell wall biosynthesis